MNFLAFVQNKYMMLLLTVVAAFFVWEGVSGAIKQYFPNISWITYLALGGVMVYLSKGVLR